MTTSKRRPKEAGGLRLLTPIWDNVADENDVVIECARAFAAAFARNPAEPRLRDIAVQAKCSRNSVRRNLAEARHRGILSLSLRLPKNDRLSEDLRNKYNLAEAVVTLTSTKWDDQRSIRAALAPEMMRYFERCCARMAEANTDKRLLRVGVDGGLTLYRAVREAVIAPLPKFEYELVPLVFGPLEGRKFAASTASIVANILGSKLEEVGVEVRIRDGFKIEADWNHSPDHRKPLHFTIEMTGKKNVLPLDVVFVGIGSGKAGLLQRELQSLPRSKRTRIQHFGDILNLAFDCEGREQADISRSRAVLLTLNDLHRLSSSASTLVIGGAGGREKVDAIRTVLRCGYISVLITDRDTATALVEQ